MPIALSFSRSRLRLSEASERSRCFSSKALLIVSLTRSRFSSTFGVGVRVPGLPLLDAAAALVLLGRLHGTAGALGSFALRLEAGRTGNIDLARLAAFARLQRRIEGGAWLPAAGALSVRGRGGRPSVLGAGAGRTSAVAGAGRAASTGAAAAATAGGAFLARSASSSRSKSWRTLAAASARARASRSSVDSPRAAAAAADLLPELRSRAASAASSAPPQARASPRSAEPRSPSRACCVLRFSTTTDLERPWLKFCRTWPDFDRPLQRQRLAHASAEGLVGGVLRFRHALPVKLQNSTHEAALRMRRSPTGSA